MSAFDDWAKESITNPEALGNYSYINELLRSAFNAGMERAEKITLTTFPNNWLNEEGYKASLTIAAYIRKEIEK